MGINKFKRPLLVVGAEVPPEGGFGGGAVDSVNGQTGDVTLAASDVGALPDSYAPAWGDVADKPTFAAVATSGAYSDLSGTPTLDFATISAIEGDWRGQGVETLGAALLALQGV